MAEASKIKIIVGGKYCFRSLGLVLEIEVVEITKPNIECKARFTRIVNSDGARFQVLEAVSPLIGDGMLYPIQFSEIKPL
jgi:hypothetical protein